MPLKIVRNNITKMVCDAIVNPTNSYLLPGGGVDMAIHKAAGGELYNCLCTLGEQQAGAVIVTEGFKLPCKHIIHIVSPIFKSNELDEYNLREAYKSVFAKAKDLNIQSIAVPLIASGENDFPKHLALRIAVDESSKFLFENEMDISLVVYDNASYEVSKTVFPEIEDFISGNIIKPQTDFCREERHRSRGGIFGFGKGECEKLRYDRIEPDLCDEMICETVAPSSYDFSSIDIDEMFNFLDDGFQKTLFRYIDKKGIDDVTCYKKANIDRKVFSKIKCQVSYKPSKNTAICFAIALELDMKDTQHLLSTAGYTLSRSNKFDLIIEYFIRREIYDIHKINEALFSFDQSLLC